MTAKDILMLRKLLKAAKEFYYNKDRHIKVSNTLPESFRHLVFDDRAGRKATVEIDDTRYDRLEALLRKVSPLAPELSTRTSVRQQEVELPYLMPSLDKKLYQEGTLEKWLAKNPGPYIIMDKLDGVSIELVFEKGQFTDLYKGGSATHGMQWSNAIPRLKLPKLSNTSGAVRAELIMSKSEFDNKWGDKYKNARNLTSGIVNKTRGYHEAIGSVEPIVFDVLHKRLKPSDALAEAKRLGFRTVTAVKADTLTESKLLTYLRKREKADHMIDGLVIAVDKPFKLTESNPKTMVAFKAPSVGNYAETEILDIEWRPSRHGRLVPRFVVEPVKLAGVTVKYATAHNARYIVDNKINVGSIVGLTRSGEVIPYVDKVIRASRTPSMPQKEIGAYEWDANGTHLLLTAGSASGAVKAIAHFFASGLEVDGLGVGLVQQLYDAGHQTVASIMALKASDFQKLDGWQTKKAQNVYSAIRTKAQSADLIKVMAASGIFGALIGERKLRALYKQRPELFERKRFTKAQITSMLSDVPGFGDKSAMPIIENLSKIYVWLDKLPITFKSVKPVKATGSKFANQIVVFTGVRDKNAEELIEQSGGTVGSSISAKTTLLVAKDPNAASSKLDKARSLNIKIITLAALHRLLQNA